MRACSFCFAKRALALAAIRDMQTDSRGRLSLQRLRVAAMFGEKGIVPRGASGGRPLQWYRAAAMFAGYRIVCGFPRHLAVNAQTRRGPSRMTRDPRYIARVCTKFFAPGHPHPSPCGCHPPATDAQRSDAVLASRLRGRGQPSLGRDYCSPFFPQQTDCLIKIQTKSTEHLTVG